MVLSLIRKFFEGFFENRFLRGRRLFCLFLFDRLPLFINIFLIDHDGWLVVIGASYETLAGQVRVFFSWLICLFTGRGFGEDE